MSQSVRPIRPYALLVGVTLGLIVVLGAVGTASYLLGFSGYTPLAAAFVPLALTIAVLLSVRRTWRAVGFRAVNAQRPSSVAAVALAAALPIGVLLCSSGVSASGVEMLQFLALAVLVAFVEETIFRGILLRVFASRRPVEAILATSIGFAVAHSATALSPDQSAAATVRTIVFAFLFGVVASLIVRATSSIWPAIVLHAAFDFAGFVLIPRSVLVTDLMSIGLAAVIVAVLVVRAGNRPAVLAARAS